MAIYEVEKLLYDIGQRESVRVEFNADLQSLLDRYGLTPEEQAAIKTINLRWLYEYGINPFLILRFNFTGQIPSREAYTKLLNQGPDQAA